jgi:hypothetical protein
MIEIKDIVESGIETSKAWNFLIHEDKSKEAKHILL